jgi:non-specific serine/threonine protein kinase/serine/threonine-protein kinase
MENPQKAPAMSGAVTSQGTDAQVDNVTHIPPSIGRYKIIRLIGQGGMGAVYEAEQDQPRRRVALNVVKPGFATADLLRR